MASLTTTTNNKKKPRPSFKPPPPPLDIDEDEVPAEMTTNASFAHPVQNPIAPPRPKRKQQRPSVVTAPTNVKKNIHVEWDAETGTFKGLPDVWQSVVPQGTSKNATSTADMSEHVKPAVPTPVFFCLSYFLLCSCCI